MTEEAIPNRGGRPPSNRLASLDPNAVAEHVYRLVADHIATQMLRLDPTSTWQLGEVSSLRFTAQMLVGYAQHGLRVTDWPHHGCARDAVQEVCEALYSCAGDPGTFGVGPLEPDRIASEAEESDPIAIALLAAWARVQIDNREEVSVRALATLAGLDPSHVRRLGRAGEIKVVDGQVSAKEARRWLGARGVEGL